MENTRPLKGNLWDKDKGTVCLLVCEWINRQLTYNGTWPHCVHEQAVLTSASPKDTTLIVFHSNLKNRWFWLYSWEFYFLPLSCDLATFERKSFKSTIFKTPPPRRRRRMSTKSPWSINVFLSNIIFCKQCTWLPLVSDNYCKVTSGTNWRHSIDLRSLVSRMIAVPTGSAEEHWKQLGAALSSPFFTLWFCIWQSRGDLSLWRSGPHSF